MLHRFITTLQLVNAIRTCPRFYVARFYVWQRLKACDALTSPLPGLRGNPAWLMAWDIDKLFNKAWINLPPYKPPVPTPATLCKDSVEVKGQCYNAGSVNYVLFGHMAQLCGWNLFEVLTIIDLYKGPLVGR